MPVTANARPHRPLATRRLTIRALQLYIDPSAATLGISFGITALYWCPAPWLVVRWAGGRIEFGAALIALGLTLPMAHVLIPADYPGPWWAYVPAWAYTTTCGMLAITGAAVRGLGIILGDRLARRAARRAARRTARQEGHAR